MKLTNSEIKKILGNWDLGSVLEIKKAEKGVVNHNWIVKTDKDKYVLRGLSKNKKLKNIKFELKYLNYLDKKGFEYELPLAIPDVKGRKIIRFGKNYVFVYRYIEGIVKKDFGKNELKEMAKMMAEYHLLLEKMKIRNNAGRSEPFLKETILREVRDYRKDIGKSKKKEDEIFLEEVKKLVPLMDNLKVVDFNKLKQYPTHSDLNPENVVWKGHKLVGVIDFENVPTGNEPLMKDISIVIQIGCSKDGEKMNFSKAKYFIKEYRKLRKLKDCEIKLLPEIILTTYIADFSYAYWMLKNDPERAKLYRLEKYSKAAQWYWKNKEKIVEELLK